MVIQMVTYQDDNAADSTKPVITMQLQNGDDDHLYDVDGDADHVYNVDGGHLGDPDGHISR